MSNLIFSIDTIPTPKIDLKNALETDVAYYLKNGKFPPLGQSAMKKQEERLNDYLKYVNEAFIQEGFSSSNTEIAKGVDTPIANWANDGQFTVQAATVTTASLTITPDAKANLHCWTSIVGNYTPEAVTTTTQVTDTDTQEVSTVTDTSYVYGTLTIEVWLDNVKKQTWKQKMIDGYNSVSEPICFPKQRKGTHIIHIKLSCDHGSLVVAAADHYAYGYGQICYLSPDNTDYFCLKSYAATSFRIDSSCVNSPTIYYSTDKDEWALVEYGQLVSMTAETPYYFRGTNSTFSESLENNVTVDVGGDYYASGNIMSLLSEDISGTTVPSNAFCGMFAGQTGLLSAPKLPALSVGDDAYNSMFWYCRKLETPPDLPATSIGKRCYMEMFSGCQVMTTAPNLPATTLAEDCYSEMFYNCKLLTAAPELPATTLAKWCYASMFSGCISLSYIKIWYAGVLPLNTEDAPFANWLASASVTGVFLFNGTVNSRGTSSVPYGWTVQTF